MTHLLDTSVLTRLSQPSIRVVVEPLAVVGRAARAGITDLEIGFSARNAQEWDKLANSLSELGLIETTAVHMRRARQTQRLLAEQGLRGRKVPDLLIAAAAELEQLTLLHYDSDFDFIATATGQKCEWIVTRGSVD
ncbi:PIN domain nuclease [Candidatus Poriferisocius sp.]|uniref:PIN domain nuclease n=1 Tax=Candidatus Poriferisocius sp. TaxID=3101276 RepID=UPI003B5215CC